MAWVNTRGWVIPASWCPRPKNQWSRDELRAWEETARLCMDPSNTTAPEFFGGLLVHHLNQSQEPSLMADPLYRQAELLLWERDRGASPRHPNKHHTDTLVALRRDKGFRVCTHGLNPLGASNWKAWTVL